MRYSQPPRLSTTRRQHQSVLRLLPPDQQGSPVCSGEPRDNSVLPEHADGAIHGLKHIPPGTCEGDAEQRAKRRNRHNAHGDGSPLDDFAPPSPPELISVSPRREFRAKWLSNTNQLEAFAQAGEADLIGGNAELGPAIRALTLLDRFPTLLDRSEVPPLALPADHPEPSLCRIESESPANGKMLYRLISAEIALQKRQVEYIRRF